MTFDKISNLSKIKENLLKISEDRLPIQILEDIAEIEFSKDEEDQILKFVKNKGIQDKLHNTYAKFEQNKEVEIAKKIIKEPNFDWKVLYPIPQKYLPIVNNEIIELNLNTNDNIVITGSGSFPATAIFIADNTKAKVSCIEKVPKYAKLATKVLNALDHKSINVICDDASKISYENFNKVLVTLLTNNKKEILHQINKYSNCKILIRSARGIINLIYPKINPAILSEFNFIKSVQYGYIVKAKK